MSLSTITSLAVASKEIAVQYPDFALSIPTLTGSLNGDQKNMKSIYAKFSPGAINTLADASFGSSFSNDIEDAWLLGSGFMFDGSKPGCYIISSYGESVLFDGVKYITAIPLSTQEWGAFVVACTCAAADPQSTVMFVTPERDQILASGAWRALKDWLNNLIVIDPRPSFGAVAFV